MNKKGFMFTKEHLYFVKENVEGRSNEELKELFNEYFGTNLVRQQIANFKNRKGIRGGKNDKNCTTRNRSVEKWVQNVNGIKENNMIPCYIFHCLNRYENTIITLKQLKKIGGEEVFLKLLKEKGFDCELRESTSYYECKQRDYETYAHKVVAYKRNEK